MDANDAVSWLFLDLNSFFASCEQQLRPELRGRPLAVTPLDSDSTCAIAASYEAKRFGIKTGTKIYEAKRLCPDLVCVPARHDVYKVFHERIKDVIRGYLPIHEVCSIDEVACRLSSEQRAPADAKALGQQIKTGLAEGIGRYVRASIGLGPNPYLAKVATELQKPDGLVAVTRDDLPEALYPLELRDLPGIGANMQARLNAVGVVDLPSLWRLSAEQMRRIWGGVVGERFWLMLHGFEVPRLAEQPRSIGHSQILAPEARHLGEARLVTRRLLAKAGTRLRRKAFLTGALTLTVKFAPPQTWAKERRFTPTADSFTLLRVLDGLWAEMRRACGGAAAPRQVAVTLSRLLNDDRHTPDLFADDEETRRTVLCQTLDALNKRYGRDTVQIGRRPHFMVAYTGAKIAFTRIPDAEDF